MDTSSTTGFLKADQSKTRSRLFSRENAGPDLEQQQAIIRIVLGTGFLAYLIYIVFDDKYVSSDDFNTLLTAALFFTFAFLLILWILWRPGVYPLRRILGIFLDNGAATSVLYFHPVLGAPLFVVYLWVAFGNGFRFGQKYLTLSACCAITGYVFAITSQNDSEVSPYVSGGILTGLILLPLYVSSLLGQLNRSLREAENANRAKSTFLATMSHEIRTPLNGLVGISQLLQKTDLTSKQKHYMELISSSSEWLMRVITDGLDFSKIEAGQFLLVNERFDLKQVVEEVAELYKSSRENSNVLFACSIDEKVPHYVIGDQLRLIQVLGNLISNALKFTENGVVTLQVSSQGQSNGNHRVQFAVEDTGIGISEEDAQSIFEPFKQATGDRIKSRKSGTGLGLAIADRLVTLMGGTISMNSVVGEGSCFIFSLPFTVCLHNDKVKETVSSQPQEVVWKKQPRILLVEDHEINSEVVIHQLEAFGCMVQWVDNGKAAVHRFEQESYDLILMDCQMPVMDGYEAARRIRSLETANGQLSPIPIVALTAHVTIEDRDRCIASGMNDYLGKPFRDVDLQNKLRLWLNNLITEGGERTVSVDDMMEEVVSRVNNEVNSKERKLIHDLKNSLFVIQGNTEISLKDPMVDGELRGNINRIKDAVQKAVKIVAEM